MTQPTDIVLAGDGYMVAPGAYRRSADGVNEGGAGRIILRDFVGGQRRAIHLEAERGWDSEGVGPAHFGQGVEPWPYDTGFADPVIGPPSQTVRAHSMLVGDAIYVGIGRFLYRSVTVSAGTWSAFTQVADLGVGNVATGLALYTAKVAICCGSTRDIQLFDPATSTLSTFQANDKGIHAVGYANRLVWSSAAAGGTNELQMNTGGGLDSRSLDSPIARMALHGGKIAIATQTSLYLLGGKSDPVAAKWIGEPEPFFTHGTWTGPDDYPFLVSYGGKLYTWLANQVMEWNPNAGASRQGWRAIGVEGTVCYGGTVAGPYLIVSLRNRAGSGQVWAYDGAGWWLIEEGAVRVWPVSLAGTGGYDLLGFRASATTYDLYRLVHRDSVAHAYRSQGSYRTSLLDAGAPNERKAWRAIRAVFASPEPRGNQSSTDPLTLTLRYSIDGGATWTDTATSVPANPATRVLDLGGALAGPLPESRYLQVEVAWSSVSDWAPVLTAIAVEYERLGDSARRRRWQIGVVARDRIVERDGSRHLRSAAEIVADLWQAWEGGATVAFRDIDYDVDPTERRVRIVGLSEQSAIPSNPASIAASHLTITLLEV
jgi:hypothetical protein